MDFQKPYGAWMAVAGIAALAVVGIFGRGPPRGPAPPRGGPRGGRRPPPTQSAE